MESIFSRRQIYKYFHMCIWGNQRKYNEKVNSNGVMIPELRNYDQLTCLYFLQCLQWVIIKHNKKHYFKIIKLFLKYNDKPGLFFFLDIKVKILGIIWTMVVSLKLSQVGELHAVPWAVGCTMPEVPFTLCSVEWHLVGFAMDTSVPSPEKPLTWNWFLLRDNM